MDVQRLVSPVAVTVVFLLLDLTDAPKASGSRNQPEFPIR